jgi:hypothetical protein
VTGASVLQVYYVDTNPSGSLDAPPGSIASGPAGFFVNLDGTSSWSPVSTQNSDIFVAPNEYYVDPTQPSEPESRQYQTVSAAISASETEQPAGQAVVLHLREGLTHSWDLSGFAALSTRRYSIYSKARATTLAISGTANNGTGASLRLETLSVTQTGNVAFGSGRSVVLQDVDLSCAGYTTDVISVFQVRSSSITNPTFLSATGVTYSFLDVSITSSTGVVGHILFDAALSGSAFRNVVISINEPDFFIFRKAGAGASATWANCSIKAAQIGSNIATLFDTGAATISVNGLAISAIRSGSGTIEWGTADIQAGSTFTQSGDAVDGMPRISNLASAVAMSTIIPSESTSIPYPTGGVQYFDRKLTIPAGSISRDGDVIEAFFQLSMTASTGNPTDIEVWVRLAGDTGDLFPVVFIQPQATNRGLQAYLRFVCDAGATGSYRRTGTCFTYDSASTAPGFARRVITSTPIDWTVDQDLEVGVNIAIGNVGDEMSLVEMDLKVIHNS